ncbi:hypothetical protein K501DRAFT_329346 [Backusella circina FSU 941]|nr:hypothetical protein K501DRAFT_329346 [Backusella circina FSU 941]
MKCLLFMLLAFVLVTSTTAKTIKNYRRGLAKDLFGLIDNLFDGELTFFHPKTEGGAQGSCGPIQDDESQIVALNADQYGDMNRKSDMCGKKVKIFYKDKTTCATITDACPGCSDGSLDLTPSVFEELDQLKVGVLKAHWCVVGTKGCDGC